MNVPLVAAAPPAPVALSEEDTAILREMIDIVVAQDGD